MPNETDSLSTLRTEVAALWDAYRRGPEATPPPAAPADVAHLRALEAQHAALLKRRDELRLERDKSRAFVGPRALLTRAGAWLSGAVLLTATAFLALPTVADLSATWPPATGLGLVAASFVTVALAVRR